MVQVTFQRSSGPLALALAVILCGTQSLAQAEEGETEDGEVPEIETTTIEASGFESEDGESGEGEIEETESTDAEGASEGSQGSEDELAGQTVAGGETQTVQDTESQQTTRAEGSGDDSDLGSSAGSFITRSHLRAALVEYRSAWERGVGFLIGDSRTVVVLGRLRDRYRPITVRMQGTTDEEIRVASVEVMEHEESAFVVLHLEGELSGEPLQISPGRPGVGESVYLILRRGMRRRDQIVPDALEVAEASITAASTTTVTVGLTWSQIWQGSPLFDGTGRVVAFFGSEGYALRVNEIFSEQRLQSGRRLLSPIVGIRVGTEFGGQLVDPFLVEFDLGLALWDQFGIVFRLGVGLGDEVLAPYFQNEDVASTALADQDTVSLGLELKYRVLITRSSMPLYIDVVAGVNYTMTILEFHDIAIYQDVNCDSRYQECHYEPGFASGRRTAHGVGPAFGFDLRAGLFTMGYRFIAEAISYELANTHRLTFGITFR